MLCPSCGAVVASGARFCASCGRPLSSGGDERRVVTVLFGDLVGFTSLSETLDPEQVKHLVDRCFERLATDITAFGGQVDKIIGDAIVALFGAPLAHEDDAERAVRAALRMQQTLTTFGAEAAGRGVQMRIGLNTGEVLVGALRTGGDYTALGDVVNTASRLQTAAAPGEVLVGPATHAATAAVIHYEDRGSLTARGREELVQAWSAIEPTLPPGHRPRRLDVPVVGRDDELTLLQHAVGTSVKHRRAHLTLLLGDAGMGKSRIAEEVGRWAELSHGAIVLEGRCVPYGEANVWWPVAEALRQSCGVQAGASVDVARAAATRAVATVKGATDTDDEVTRVVNGLLTLMGYEGPRQVDPASVREEGVRSLVEFIEASTQHQPSVIVLSDLHWADDLLLDLIDTLLERLHRHPLVLVATARRTLTERWAPRLDRHDVLVLNLDPLGPDATAELLGSLLGDRPTPEVAQALIDRSGGNPFFLEELVALLHSQPARLGGGGGSSSGDAPEGRVDTLPDTLRGLVAARIDALTPEERAVLQDAAVLGRRAPVYALQAMATELRRTIDVEAAIAGLVEKDVLEVGDGMWSFRSDMVREVAYNTITKLDRAQRHAGIAAYIEGEAGGIEAGRSADGHLPDHILDQVSHHYGVATELASELGALDQFKPGMRDRAVDWIERAAYRARDGRALSVAAKLFTQALTLVGPTTSARRLQLLLGRASARTEAWELSGARADVEEATAEAEQLGDEQCRARALLVLGEVQQKAGDIPTAVETLRRAAHRFAELGDEDGRAEAHRQIGMAELFRGHYDDAERSVSAALEAFRSLDQARGEAWALQNLAWIAFVTGRLGKAERWLHDSVATFTEIGDASGRAWALGLFAYVRFHQGNVDEAEVLGTQILHDARTRGDRWATGMMLVLLSSVRLWAGRTEEAIEVAREAKAAFSAIGDPYGLAQSGCMVGRSLVMSGRIDEGFAALAEAHEVADQAESSEEAISLIVAIATAVQVGEPERLAALLADLDDGVERRGARTDDPASAPPEMLERSVALVMTALQQGDRSSALAGAEQLDDATNDPDHSPNAGAAQALAFAAAGQHDRAVQFANGVVGSGRATYLDRVMASIAAGLAEAAAGQAGSARRWLTVASENADATGDRVAQAVARLASAAALEHLADPAAADMRTAATSRLRALGLTATGWSTAFALCLGR